MPTESYLDRLNVFACDFARIEEEYEVVGKENNIRK